MIFFSNQFDILLILNFIGETFEIYIFHGEHKNKKYSQNLFSNYKICKFWLWVKKDQKSCPQMKISLRYLVIIAKRCLRFLRTLLIYKCENLQKMLSLLFHFFKRLLLLWCRLNSVWVDVFLNKKNFFKKHFGLLSKCFFLNALNNKLSKPPIFQTIKIFISPLILIFYFFIKLFDIILYLIFIK